MGCNVFANGSEIACKAGTGNVIAEFPDVCLSPPSPPAGPVPIPYPATSSSKDMQGGSKTVKIGGQEVMMKDSSYYKSSPLGDEAATRSFGANVMTHQITGKTYFTMWSMDVKIEGANADRHMDMTTSNHASQPPGTPPSTINAGGMSPSRLYPEQTCEDARREEIHQEKDAICNSIPGPSCSPSRSPKMLGRIPCSKVKARVAAQKNCVAKRQQMKDECFNTPPDPADPAQVKRADDHNKAMTEMKDGLANSQAQEAINCKPGHKMAGL